MFRGYAVALVAAVFFSASAQAVANKAIVRAIRDGSAYVSMDAGKSWKPAKVGAVLPAHSAIRTDATATADLFLGDNGPVVRVTKDTTMGIDKLDVDSTGIEKVIETQLDLKNGRILGNVKKMAAASKYEVKTPVGVAGIRGTEYSISADGKVSVVSGTVVVVYIVGNTPQPPVTLQAGQQVTPPTVNGVAPTLTSVDTAVVNEIPTLTVYLTPEPVPPGTSVTITPGPTTPPTSNFDTTNSPLTEDKPGSQSNSQSNSE